MDVKVKPEHIENAIPAALAKNGYKPENWQEAVSLKSAIEQYAEKTKDCIFCAYNATFDWGFMNHAFRVTGVQDDMDYHRLDVLSMLWKDTFRKLFFSHRIKYPAYDFIKHSDKEWALIRNIIGKQFRLSENHEFHCYRAHTL